MSFLHLRCWVSALDLGVYLWVSDVQYSYLVVAGRLVVVGVRLLSDRCWIAVESDYLWVPMFQHEGKFAYLM